MKQKMRRILWGLMAMGVVLAVVQNAAAGHHEKTRDKKVGIVLAAFGSSDPRTQVAFDNIEKKVSAAFPDVQVFWAYTSHMIRQKMAEQGNVLASPETALARMADEKFTHVAVQSLHTIAGAEYHDLRRTVGAFESMGHFTEISLGDPLLGTQDSMEKAVDAIFSMIPEQRDATDAVVFMGHGSHHPANAFYAALMFQVQVKDPNIYIGTVGGYPEIDEIMPWLVEKKVKTVWLLPFMSVAGDHARNDMAGGDADSWISVLTRAGMDCRPVLKGTAEVDAFVDIWVDHLKRSMSHF
ncbi:MAG: sirohydrochlorin cobaltochelatase [Desulfotignum sp.]